MTLFACSFSTSRCAWAGADIRHSIRSCTLHFVTLGHSTLTARLKYQWLQSKMRTSLSRTLIVCACRLQSRQERCRINRADQLHISTADCIRSFVTASAEVASEFSIGFQNDIVRCIPDQIPIGILRPLIESFGIESAAFTIHFCTAAIAAGFAESVNFYGRWCNLHITDRQTEDRGASCRACLQPQLHSSKSREVQKHRRGFCNHFLYSLVGSSPKTTLSE